MVDRLLSCVYQAVKCVVWDCSSAAGAGAAAEALGNCPAKRVQRMAALRQKLPRLALYRVRPLQALYLHLAPLQPWKAWNKHFTSICRGSRSPSQCFSRQNASAGDEAF